MLATLVFILIIFSAVVFGIFFVIFKIGFLLFKKKRNFWPLVLAAITTLLLVALTTIATYTVYQRFTKPFAPIIQAAKNIVQPITGTNTYTDSRYGFSLTLYDGMTLGDWIALKNQHDMDLLAGLDVNIFAKTIFLDIKIKLFF